MFDNENKRIDSEYFKKQFIDFFQNVPNLRPLQTFVKNGYRVVYENTNIVSKEEAETNGFPYFLQATDLDTPFIETENLFYVNSQDWKRYPKGRIRQGEILIEVKGKVDKVAIVPNNFPEYTLVTGSLFKLTVNDKISKHILLTFLISKYGKAFKDRYKTNSLISYVSKPDLYRIPIPNFSKEFQARIDNILKIIFSSKNKSKQCYQEAEQLLLQEIGLEDFEPGNSPPQEGGSQTGVGFNVKSYKENFGTSGRLDAEYYQKKYEDIVELIHSYKKGFESLKLACILKDENYKPAKNTLYKYVELSNIDKTGNISGCTKEMGHKLPSRARHLINIDDVLVSSIEGSLDSCGLVTEEYNNAICSTGFYVINSTKISSETLLVLFKSEVMQNILKQNCSGTILTAINKNEFLNIPVPLINNECQQQITELVKKSFSLKKQSEHLLEVAKRAVEKAIEESERMALGWMNEQIKSEGI